jgi:hypothetical protein
LICAKYENVKFNLVVAERGFVTKTMPSVPQLNTGVVSLTVSLSKTALGDRDIVGKIEMGAVGAVVMGRVTDGDFVGEVAGGAETGDLELISVGSGVGSLVYTIGIDMDMDIENDMDMSIM